MIQFTPDAPVSKLGFIADAQQPSIPNTPVQNAPIEPTTFDNYVSQLDQANNELTQSGQQMQNAINPMAQNQGGFLNRAKNLGEGLLGAGAGAATAIFAPITAPVTTILHHASLTPTGQDVINSAPVQTATKAITDWATLHPELSKTLSDALTVATAGIGGETGIAKASVEDIAKGVKKSVSKGISDLPPPPPGTPSVIDSRLQGVAKDWARPLEENTASFNKTRKIADKTPDIPQFLAEQGVNPSTHIEDGRYVTKDTATSLRDTAGKMSADTLRPSLQMADYTVPRTPVFELEKEAILNAKQTKGITAGNMESVIEKIKSESTSLKKKYPDGMSLTDMHDEKITYAKNGGYSPVNDPAVNNTATANRSFSSILGKTVEDKVPDGVPVKDFNSYLSKYYKAADYLDSLNTKKAPVTLTQQIARGVAKFGGAAIGGHFGGGIVSEFAGYQIGKAIEHALENLSNPARESFLRNLKVTNPEAFMKVEQYLGKEKADQATRVLLPKPSMIPMSGETPKSVVSPDANRVQVLKADKGQVGMDKKGKFIKTYKSSGTKEEKPMKTVNPLLKR